MYEISPEVLAAGASVLLTLGFTYVPKLNTWYAAKDEQTKKLIMLGLLVVVAAASFGLACGNVLEALFGVALTCDQAGGLSVIRALILAIVANQSVYKITPQPQAVRRVRALAKG